ncbi:MAG: DUF6382 domain-containing protein [Suilimivivens sp.]
MAEVKYYKDFKHNYLIMKNEDSPTDMYQCRMITGNRIEGLLPCQERHINGEMLLYYEITSKQSLSSLYENRCINRKQLNRIFLQLKMVWEGISKFLLNESNLMLKPEFIFADAETEELSFLYYPFETDENYMISLLEFLADRVDSEDKDATEIAYKMLDLAGREQFVLDEVLQWFEEDCEEFVRMDIREQRQEETEKIGHRASMTQPDPQENDFCMPQRKDSIEEKSRSNSMAACGGMIFAAVLGGILYYVFITYQLSEKELIYLYAGFILAGILFLTSGAVFLYIKFFINKVTEKEKSSGLWNRDREDDKEDGLYQNTVVCENIQQKAEQAYGNTIFIPWVENCENKLYGTGKGNKNHIDLNRLPLTVGKLAGSVDMVIEDQSISRRHVKFAREGNRIYMTDLNSTNGTFKNGLRLQPNMSEVLEPGDEIRLGKLKFIYR